MDVLTGKINLNMCGCGGSSQSGGSSWSMNGSNKVIDVDRESLAPVPTIVTLEEVKAYCRIDFDDSDAELESMILAAIARIESLCGISLLHYTVTATLELINRQELPYGPVRSITTTGLTTLGTKFPRVVGSGAFTVEYETGYEIAPDDLKEAIKAEVLFRYENRGWNEEKLSPESEILAMPYKRTWML